ncbi:hypothetical protein MA9V1_235 [Chryseobacterium phage MA9V-1]|nr:hypothetical protein MA9V1_235 [Chryseobacterium phage MA9V-1]
MKKVIDIGFVRCENYVPKLYTYVKFNDGKFMWYQGWHDINSIHLAKLVTASKVTDALTKLYNENESKF